MANEPINARQSADDPEILEKIVDDFTKRIRAGEHPAIAEYQEKFPELKDEVEDLLASVAMIEQLKPSSTTPTRDRRSLDEVSSLKKIGDYKIVGELGRGGMGIVFEAIHESLGRRVAIKVMPTPLLNKAKYIERFGREAQAAARLHHTNIVSVFGVGEGDGYYYYIMDYVDGQTLRDIVDGLSPDKSGVKSASTKDKGSTHVIEKNSDSREPTVGSDPAISGTHFAVSPATGVTSKHFRWSARIGVNIADALSYAHQSNILHRDIKPSNLILDRKGVVWITDFGLAKDSSSDINLTKTGDVIGTPQYLAPESLEGKYDQRSEVYCLGLTLYELATLQPAYKNGSTAEVIRAIATSSPVPPKKVNSKIPIDLSTIIEKATSRDPDSRYQTAARLRSDLLAFVEDRPISARPLSTFENVVKWGRRNPLAAILSGVSALLLTLVAVSASIGYLYTIDAYNNEFEAKNIAQAEKVKAEKFAQRMKIENDRADANIEITLEAFDQMFTQVLSRGSSSGTRIDVEGFEELMGIETTVTREDAAFLDKLLAFYDRFATQNAESESLQMESARAFRRVANIEQLVGQYQPSVEAYKKSINLYESILDKTPDSKEMLIALVQTKSELGRALRRNSGQANWEEAKKQNASAVKLIENFPADELDNELKLELAKTLNSLGSSNTLLEVLGGSGANGGGPGAGRRTWEDFIREAFKRRGPRELGGGSLVRIPPGGRRADEKRRPGEGRPGRGQGRIGDNRPPNDGRGARPGRRGPGVDTIGIEMQSRASLSMLDELVESEPENVEYRSARVNSYCILAATLIVPDPEKARTMRQQAIDELEKLIETDDGNPSYRFRLAMACLLSDFANPSEDDLELLKKSIAVSEELKTQFPEVLDYHSLNGSVHNKHAGVLIRNGKLDEAFSALKLAKTSFMHVVELLPRDRGGAMRIIRAYSSHVNLLAQKAEESNRKGLARQARGLLTQFRRHQ